MQILHVHKGHLQVDLGEFRLPVSPQVLVPEAAGELHGAVEARNHGQLLIDLRRLGQGIKLPPVQAGGDEKIPGAFGGGFDKHGGFDLQEALAVEIIPCGFGDLMPHPQIPLQLGTPQIEVAVFQPGRLGRVAVLDDLEGRCLGTGQDPQLLHLDLDVTGGQFGIDRGTHPYPASGGEDVFPPHTPGFLEHSGRRGLVKGELDDTGAVPQIHEDQLPKIPLPLHPAEDRRVLSCVIPPELPAIAGALQSFDALCHDKFVLSVVLHFSRPSASSSPKRSAMPASCRSNDF